jgi:hypothetical protein
MGYYSRSKTNPDLRRKLEEKILRQMRLVADKPSLSTEEVINLMDKLGSRAQDLSACLEADDKFSESVRLYQEVAQTFTTAIQKAPAIYRRPLEILERFWKTSAESKKEVLEHKEAAARKSKRSAFVTPRLRLLRQKRFESKFPHKTKRPTTGKGTRYPKIYSTTESL